MKNYLQSFLLTVFFLLSSQSLFAYDFESGGIYYNILSQDDKTVAVTNQYQWGGSYLGNIVILSTVEYEGVEYSVIAIGDKAFYNCWDLTSITIPNSVTSIGNNAFYACSGLLDCYVEWDIPLDIPANVFEYSNNGSATLHVPTGTKARYEAAEVWKNFGTIVEYTVSGLDAVIANKQPGRLYRLDGTSVPSGQKMKGAMIIDGRAVIIR